MLLHLFICVISKKKTQLTYVYYLLQQIREEDRDSVLGRIISRQLALYVIFLLPNMKHITCTST